MDESTNNWTKDITTLIFDIDDTLYDTSTGFTDHRQGDAIFDFMVAKLNFPDTASAKVVRDEYFKRYHSTAKALTVAEEEGRLPASSERFNVQDMSLWWAEKLNFSLLGGPYNDLAQMLSSCPLKLVAFSNGPRKYVLRVLKELGLEDVFQPHNVFAVDDVLPSCKPEKEAFQKVFDSTGVENASQCIMVEDSMKNIRAAKNLGMRTVLITGLKGDQTEDDPAYGTANKIEDDPAVDIAINTASQLKSALPSLWEK